MTDLVIRGATIIGPDGRRSTDVACDNGRIVAVDLDDGVAREEIDARGLLLLPGVIDVHLHFNEPGRTDWEGAATGSHALAAGGGVMFADMPLNSTPCTVDAREFARKRAALEESSITDFALWGGLTPGSLDHMEDMAAEGAMGFKAFMCDSGLPEFPMADDEVLAAGMEKAARLGLPVAVHAEDESIVRRHATAATGSDVQVFLASRPIDAELSAITRALHLARETGASLHIVHVSSGAGVALAAAARLEGVDVSIETCPHYLLLTDADLDRLGAVAKCAPPLRAAPEQAALWRHLSAGDVDIVASDHSPTAPANKAGRFRDAWGGIAGVQTTLSALLDRALDRGDLTLEQVASLLAVRPAARFALPGKGTIAPGYDADFVLVDPSASVTLAADDLHQRHRTSPYVGRRFCGAVRRTIRRGETIAMDGRITARTRGHFVAPARTHT